MKPGLPGFSRSFWLRIPRRELLIYGLLACLFVITTGFGIYSFGPWRVYVVAAAVLVSVGFTLSEFLAPSEPRLETTVRASASDPATEPKPETVRPASRLSQVKAEVVLLAFAIAALWGNWGWAGEPRLLPLLHAVLVATGLGCAVQVIGLAREWYPRRQSGSSSELQHLESPLPGSARRREHSMWPLYLAAATLFYTALIVTVASPYIDVWYQMNEAGKALLAGKNPYSSPIPDFYKGQAWYGFDSPGFPYPPLVLLNATLARLLGLDVRFLLLACVLLGAMLARATALRSGWSCHAADLVGMLYLFVPRQSFVVKYSHSEPISGLLLVAALFLLVSKRERLGLLFLGLFLGSKQYLIVVAPLVLLFCRSPRRLAWCLAGATAPWLPFVVLNPQALWAAAFEVHMQRPARKDALTLSAWLIARGLSPLARWIPLAAGGLAAIVQGLRVGSSVPRLALGIASSLMITLFLSPQAFGNYYLLVTWAVLGAAATSAPCLPCVGQASTQTSSR
ncbi:MAG: hypothetical protein V2A73_13400 [Pseudomonadota bacterium]